MKSFKLLLIIILIGAIGFSVYYYWDDILKLFSVSQETIQTPQQPAETEKIKLLSQTKVFGYWVNETKNAIYALTENGKIISLRDGNEKNESDEIIANLVKLLPSADGRQAIIAFGNAQRPQFSLFNSTDNSWQPLPLEITNLTWIKSKTQLGDLIAFIDTKKGFSLEAIDLSKTNSTNTKLVNDLGLEDVEMTWSGNETIIFTERPSFSYYGGAWSLNLKDFKFRQIFQPEPGLITSWSKDGLSGLKFSVTLPNFYNLALTDNQGTTVKNLPFATLPEKCLLEKDAAYCFVPKEISEEWRLPDDYLQKAFYSNDLIYRIPTGEGETRLLLDASQNNIDGTNPQRFEGKLIFINRYDGKLYSFDLNE